MIAATVAIGVFGLFHPQSLEIEPYGRARVEVRCGTATILEGNRRMRLSRDCTASGPNGAPVDFVLSVPGKIRRHYLGTLETRKTGAEIFAIVTMSLETAVASTVAAEAPTGAAKAMLEAQAIVSRSYLSAHKRHRDFDFCDTTHCQFIKDPPSPESSAARAAHATAGQVLLYRGQVVAAFYAARCGGLLAPLPAENVGDGDYPYFAVHCEYCARNPVKDAPKANARPHHHGMCQLGADDLAKQAWSTARILAHYYPGTELR